MTKPLRGADIVARSLARLGCRHVFTLSGNHIMSIFDAALEAKLDLVHVRHEAAAVHMANAWGRLTGDAGIALVTGGPGHASAVGAIFNSIRAAQDQRRANHRHTPCPKEVLDRIARGEVVKASGYYVRTAPFFETASEKYKCSTALSPSASVTGCLGVRSPRCSRFSSRLLKNSLDGKGGS
jgi:hypothetical protein